MYIFGAWKKSFVHETRSRPPIIRDDTLRLCCAHSRIDGLEVTVIYTGQNLKFNTFRLGLKNISISNRLDHGGGGRARIFTPPPPPFFFLFLTVDRPHSRNFSLSPSLQLPLKSKMAAIIFVQKILSTRSPKLSLFFRLPFSLPYTHVVYHIT